MADKRNPGRFTLLFNMADPRQQRAVELLNAQGRSKAMFLTAAVLHYVGEDAPGLPQSAPSSGMTADQIELIVRRVLAQQAPTAPLTAPAVSVEVPSVPKPAPPPEPKPAPVALSAETSDEIPADLYDSIAQVVTGFRT